MYFRYINVTLKNKVFIKLSSTTVDIQARVNAIRIISTFQFSFLFLEIFLPNVKVNFFFVSRIVKRYFEGKSSTGIFVREGESKGSGLS
mgnify:CR=1 FL=1